MRYVYTKKAKEKSKKEKDDEYVERYYGSVFGPGYADLMTADDEEEEASRKEAEAPGDERR